MNSHWEDQGIKYYYEVLNTKGILNKIGKYIEYEGFKYFKTSEDLKNNPNFKYISTVRDSFIPPEQIAFSEAIKKIQDVQFNRSNPTLLDEYIKSEGYHRTTWNVNEENEDSYPGNISDDILNII